MRNTLPQAVLPSRFSFPRGGSSHPKAVKHSAPARLLRCTNTSSSSPSPLLLTHLCFFFFLFLPSRLFVSRCWVLSRALTHQPTYIGGRRLGSRNRQGGLLQVGSSPFVTFFFCHHRCRIISRLSFCCCHDCKKRATTTGLRRGNPARHAFRRIVFNDVSAAFHSSLLRPCPSPSPSCRLEERKRHLCRGRPGRVDTFPRK